MTGQEAVEVIELMKPRQAIPVHYEGWKHFREGRDAVERTFRAAPPDVRDRVRWVPIGSPVTL